MSWITATEINNDYFDIERSSNGIEFTAIHKMKGGGNSTQMLDYNLPIMNLFKEFLITD
ncbi:MAG: hypothetical protein IPH33_10790 [Bacteroidetes bacterium]|nr:hypothetical protein [Bacteroidota bacterium]